MSRGWLRENDWIALNRVMALDGRLTRHSQLPRRHYRCSTSEVTTVIFNVPSLSRMNPLFQARNSHGARTQLLAPQPLFKKPFMEFWYGVLNGVAATRLERKCGRRAEAASRLTEVRWRRQTVPSFLMACCVLSVLASSINDNGVFALLMRRLNLLAVSRGNLWRILVIPSQGNDNAKNAAACWSSALVLTATAE